VDTNRESDLIHTPRANIRATWQATRDSALSVGLGVGYSFYTENSDYNRLNISPDSEIAWDIPVGDWVFTLADRCFYSSDVASQGAISGRAEYPRLENTIGVRARWMPDRYVVHLGYGHYNFFSDSDTYDYLNRASEQFFGRAGYRLAEVTEVGIEASGALTSYDSILRENNQNASVGPYLNWQITEATELSLHGGYVMYVYDGNTSELSSWYIGGQFRNQLTDSFSHGISLSREVQQGFYVNSDYIELLAARYFLTWAFHRQGTLTADVNYEYGKQPRTFMFPPFPFPVQVDEAYDRVGFGVSLNWQFTRHLYSSLGYRFYNKNSDLDQYGIPQDYLVNTVTLSAFYQF
jgi:hypothetical protein